MLKSKFVFVAIISITLTACASSSGVLSIGNSTYSLTTQAATAAAAKQDALNEANAFCKNTSKEIQATHMRPSSDAFGWHSYEIHFRCV